MQDALKALGACQMSNFTDLSRKVVARHFPDSRADMVHDAPWLLFPKLEIEAVSHFSYNFEQIRYLPVRLALNEQRCATYIRAMQNSGENEYGEPYGPQPRAPEYFLGWWLEEAIGKMHGLADIAYSLDRIDPRTFGFDIVIEDGSHWAVHSWFRGEKHLLEALFPTCFSD